MGCKCWVIMIWVGRDSSVVGRAMDNTPVEQRTPHTCTNTHLLEVVLGTAPGCGVCDGCDGPAVLDVAVRVDHLGVLVGQGVGAGDVGAHAVTTSNTRYTAQVRS